MNKCYYVNSWIVDFVLEASLCFILKAHMDSKTQVNVKVADIIAWKFKEINIAITMRLEVDYAFLKM